LVDEDPPFAHVQKKKGNKARQQNGKMVGHWQLTPVFLGPTFFSLVFSNTNFARIYQPNIFKENFATIFLPNVFKDKFCKHLLTQYFQREICNHFSAPYFQRKMSMRFAAQYFQPENVEAILAL
jgi:hypothetical protein